jgi:hypothetical protein
VGAALRARRLGDAVGFLAGALDERYPVDHRSIFDALSPFKDSVRPFLLFTPRSIPASKTLRLRMLYPQSHISRPF